MAPEVFSNLHNSMVLCLKLRAFSWHTEGSDIPPTTPTWGFLGGIIAFSCRGCCKAQPWAKTWESSAPTAPAAPCKCHFPYLITLDGLSIHSRSRWIGEFDVSVVKQPILPGCQRRRIQRHGNGIALGVSWGWSPTREVGLCFSLQGV